jgi:3-methyladenine DNA glycosylase AlkD
MAPIEQVRTEARSRARGFRNDPHELVVEASRLALAGREEFAFELFRAAPRAVLVMTPAQVRALLPTLHDWKSTDCFGSFVSGVAWREGVLADRDIQSWARSSGLWIRRAALVSTVPLNLNARGSTAPKGEPARTLRICEMLADDHEDMIVKAVSWALRVLATKNPAAVRRFLGEHEHRLAARVLRETRNKLTTGLKNPKKGGARRPR